MNSSLLLHLQKQVRKQLDDPNNTLYITDVVPGLTSNWVQQMREPIDVANEFVPSFQNMALLHTIYRRNCRNKSIK